LTFSNFISGIGFVEGYGQIEFVVLVRSYFKCKLLLLIGLQELGKPRVLSVRDALEERLRFLEVTVHDGCLVVNNRQKQRVGENIEVLIYHVESVHFGIKPKDKLLFVSIGHFDCLLTDHVVNMSLNIGVNEAFIADPKPTSDDF